MATIEELYEKVLADEAERAAFAEAGKTPEGLRAFLADRCCDATPEAVAAFLQTKRAEQGEISDEELDSVAGGCNTSEGYISITSLGLGCAMSAIASAVKGDMEGAGGRILCADEKWVGKTKFDGEA